MGDLKNRGGAYNASKNPNNNEREDNDVVVHLADGEIVISNPIVKGVRSGDKDAIKTALQMILTGTNDKGVAPKGDGRDGGGKADAKPKKLNYDPEAAARGEAGYDKKLSEQTGFKAMGRDFLGLGLTPDEKQAKKKREEEAMLHPSHVVQSGVGAMGQKNAKIMEMPSVIASATTPEAKERGVKAMGEMSRDIDTTHTFNPSVETLKEYGPNAGHTLAPVDPLPKKEEAPKKAVDSGKGKVVEEKIEEVKALAPKAALEDAPKAAKEQKKDYSAIDAFNNRSKFDSDVPIMNFTLKGGPQVSKVKTAHATQPDKIDTEFTREREKARDLNYRGKEKEQNLEFLPKEMEAQLQGDTQRFEKLDKSKAAFNQQMAQAMAKYNSLSLPAERMKFIKNFTEGMDREDKRLAYQGFGVNQVGIIDQLGDKALDALEKRKEGGEVSLNKDQRDLVDKLQRVIIKRKGAN
jgi:hypothetical protein